MGLFFNFNNTVNTNNILSSLSLSLSLACTLFYLYHYNDSGCLENEYNEATIAASPPPPTTATIRRNNSASNMYPNPRLTSATTPLMSMQSENGSSTSSSRHHNKGQQQTIECVLTNFVDFIMTRMSSKSSSSSSRSFIEFILADVVFAFAKAQKSTSPSNHHHHHHLTSIAERSTIVQSYSRHHYAKEIPTMILFYTYKNRGNHLHCQHRLQRLMKDDIHSMNLVLCQLIDYLWTQCCFIDRKHRKELLGKLQHPQAPQLHHQHHQHHQQQHIAAPPTKQILNIKDDKLSPETPQQHQHDKMVTDNHVQSSSNKKNAVVVYSSADDEKHTIDGEKIILQLNILKEGRYWKYLPKEEDDNDGDDGDDTNNHDSGRGHTSTSLYHSSAPQSVTYHEYETDKENVSYVSNQNPLQCRLLYEHGVEDREEEEEEDGNNDEENDEEEDHEFYDDDEDQTGMILDRRNNHGSIRPIYQCCVISGDPSHGGFCVVRVTDDGWLCSKKKSSTSRCNDMSVEEDGLQGPYLLRLPLKVGKLGREGMTISGIDLMKRLDNGILEPSNASEVCEVQTKLIGAIEP